MTHPANVDTLNTKHARLEAKLDEETHRPMPDETVIKEIKREKLRIKDQLAASQGV